jgi:hypothetical protein
MGNIDCQFDWMKKYLPRYFWVYLLGDFERDLTRGVRQAFIVGNTIP